MPEMNGIELIEKLKSNEKTRDIPVIMCTGIMTDSKNLETA
jgi:CheY-like chemotaxis protein